MPTNGEETNLIQPRTALLTGMVVAAAALRLLPHPMNFTPVGALALFGGASFRSKRMALALPLVSLIAADIFVGFHSLMPYVYASFLVSVAIGFWLRRNRSVVRVGAGVLAGAIQFFLVTNFALWAASIGAYPKTPAGLAACYIAGIPDFWNTLAGDAFYSAVLFGGLALIEHRFPGLRERMATLRPQAHRMV
jgi:hypothetical protein